MAKVVIETELSTKNFDRQIQKLKTDIARYMRVLESDTKVPISLRMSPAERQELETTIEKLRNRLVGLENQASRVGNIGQEAGEKSGQGFEKGIKSLKRFSLALFGVRSVFMLVRRATSTYLSQNETTADKINAIWVALGNALAPIIEMIADGVIKLIGYLNVFLQALGFDIDLTKNMNKSKKAIKDTTKAMKELNRQVTTFDEMTIQQSESKTDSQSLTNTFKMPELNQDIVKFLQDTAGWLKENWTYLALIGGVIATYKVANWLSGLGKIIGTPTTGLMGVSKLLKGLATIGVIAVGVNLIYDAVTGRKLIDDLTTITKGLKELPDINKGLSKSAQTLTKDLKKVNEENGKVNISYEKGSKEIQFYIGNLQKQIDNSKNVISAKEKEQKSNNILEAAVKSLTGTTQKAKIIEEEHLKRIIDATIEMGKYASQGKLTEDQLKNYAGAVDYLKDKEIDLKDKLKETYLNMVIPENIKKKQIDYYQDMLKQIDDIKTQTKNKFSDINSIIAKPKVEVQTNVDKAKQVLEALSKSSIFGGIATTTINALKRIGLAKGGIYNNPGKGVSMSNVVVGEATNGAEGVVPLNNEQSMDLIGQSIAKHVVINLTTTTLLDNKVISRQQSKITDATNFATNGRGV